MNLYCLGLGFITINPGKSVSGNGGDMAEQKT